MYRFQLRGLFKNSSAGFTHNSQINLWEEGGGALVWGWGGRGHLRIKQPSVPLLVTVSVAVSYSLYLRVFGYLCCNMENITESYVGLLKIVISQRIKT